jgi:general secretion pathway protein J
MSARAGKAGFTLVEVLIALLIFALLAAAGAVVLSQTINTRFAIQANTDRVADLQRLRALLKADLAQATSRRTRAPTGRPLPRPLMGPEQPGDPVLVLARSGWSNPDAAPRSSLQRVEYRLVEDRLERRVSPYLDGARAGAPQVLYRGVKDVAVSFVNDGGEAPAFIPTAAHPLPDAVRIVMTLDGFGRVEQLLLVASA